MTQPNVTFAVQDAGSLALWAAINAEGKVPDTTTLLGCAAGPALWQYYFKQRADSYVKKITAGEVAKAAAGILTGDTTEAAEVAADIEDNTVLYVLGRPLCYLVALYAVGQTLGNKLTLPEYLTIAATGAGTGSFLRSNYFNKSASNSSTFT